MLVGGCAGLWSATSASSSDDAVESMPEPTGACPYAQDQPAPTGCVPYDGEALMQGNDAYRQRFEVDDEQRAALEPRRQAAQDALAAVPADALSAAEVTSSLEGAGFDEQHVFANESTFDGVTVVSVIISISGSCLIGSVGSASPGVAEMDTAGPIADGGCVTAPGH